MLQDFINKAKEEQETIIQEWIVQGRSEEQIYGVGNFFTGIGATFLTSKLTELAEEMAREIEVDGLNGDYDDDYFNGYDRSYNEQQLKINQYLGK